MHRTTGRRRDAAEGKAGEAGARKRAKGGSDAQRIVGLKIGASQLAAATLSNNGAAELLQVARHDLAPGIVVGGELREPEKLSEALQEFFDRNSLPKRNVRLGVANNRIGVRTFDITGVADPTQLDNAVRFRAQETLPIPIDDAVLDYHVLSETTDLRLVAGNGVLADAHAHQRVADPDGHADQALELLGEAAHVRAAAGPGRPRRCSASRAAPGRTAATRRARARTTRSRA